MWSDLPSEHWARQYIQALADREILRGFPDGTFRPDAQITRAQFAAVISKAFTKPNKRDPIEFTDVPSVYWASEAIAATYARGFLSGYPEQRFGPEQPITRGEVLVSLASGLEYTPSEPVEATLSVYEDGDQIPGFAIAALAAATEKNLVVNYPQVSLLNPRREASRAEVAAILYQALVSLGEVPALASAYVPGLTQGTEESSGETPVVAQTTALITQLESPDATVREQAAQALVQQSAAAVPELVKALQKESIRPQVSDILTNIGDNAVPVLIAALQQDQGYESVLDVLVRIGAVSTLVGAVENNKMIERTGTALVRIGQPAVPELVAALKKEALHDKAVAVLTQIGEPALADMMAALTDDDQRLQKGVAAVLGQLGQPAIAALIRALPTDDDSLKTGIAAVVKQLDQPAITALVSALQRDDDNLRDSLGDVLAQVGQPAVPELIKVLRNDDARFHENVAVVLKQMGQPTVSALITVLMNDHDEASQRAADVLAAIGQPAASELITSLSKESLLAPDSKAGQKVQATLAKVVGQDAVSVLVTALRTFFAQKERTEAGPETTPETPSVDQAVQAQLEILKTAQQDRPTLDRVAEELSKLGVPAIRAVTDLLKDDDPVVQASAAYVLGKLGSDAIASIPELIKQLRNGDAEVRSASNHALNHIDPLVTRVLLMDALQSGERPEEREEAAKAIGEIPPTAAVPDFVSTAMTSTLASAAEHDESPAVKAASAAAL
ncbi:MAG: S-layer homology domain-containing protein [Cyanobacteria bacterium J06635_1]